jgi:hypothetical protein
LTQFSVGPLFGTFDRATATPAEVTWSTTFQTAISNFIKDPSRSPAVNWPKYVPGPATNTLAKLAYNGNVDPDNFVDAVQSNSLVSLNLTTSFVDFLLIIWTEGRALRRVVGPVFGFYGLNAQG